MQPADVMAGSPQRKQGAPLLALRTPFRRYGNGTSLNENGTGTLTTRAGVR